MLSLAKSVDEYVLIRKKNVPIVNWVFQLHHQITLGILLLSTAIVCSTDWIGEKILCTHSDVLEGSSKKLDHVLNHYCFFMSLYIVKEYYNNSANTGEVAHPGVGPWDLDGDESGIEYLRWYQWVPFFLLFQAMLFYVPYLIWQITENGALKRLIRTFNRAELEMHDKKGALLNKTIDGMLVRLKSMQKWAYVMFFCEVLNLLNVIFQFWFTDVFLGGRFWNLGSEAAEFYLDESYSPLDVAFPKVAKCTFRKFGPTGSLQVHDAACVLSTNIANEKVFLILWWWYIPLIIVSAGMVLYRLASRLLHTIPVRYEVKSLITNVHAKLNVEHIERIVDDLDYGTWVVFSYILSNLNPILAQTTLKEVSQQIMDKKRKEIPFPEEIPSPEKNDILLDLN